MIRPRSGRSAYGLCGVGAAGIVLLIAGTLARPTAASAEDQSLKPKISSGHHDTLLLGGDGSVWSCSGNSARYMSGSSEGGPSPQLPSGSASWISAGDDYGFVNTQAAGHSYSGALGNDFSTPDFNVLRSVPPIVNHPVAGGNDNEVTFYISKGRLWAAGDNSFGMLGRGGSDRNYINSVFSPVVDVNGDPLKNVRSVAEGALVGMAVLSDGSVWTWGGNDNGQLGDGSHGGIRSYAAPVAALAGTRIVAVSASIDAVHHILSGDHVLALAADGTVWAWGENQDGEVGDGSVSALDPLTGTSPEPNPVRVRTADGKVLRGVVAIAAGAVHSLALRSDGSVWSWGYNGSGQLGNGTAAEGPNPYAVRVSGLRNIASIAAASAGSFAMDRRGRVWAWGWNYYENLCLGAGYFPTGTENDAFLPENNIAIPTRVLNADGTYFNLLAPPNGASKGGD